MSINVVNQSQGPISVCMNRWGPGGSTEWYEIAPDKEDQWDREDSRGFLVWIKWLDDSHERPYFATRGSTIFVHNHLVSRRDPGKAQAYEIPGVDGFVVS